MIITLLAWASVSHTVNHPKSQGNTPVWIFKKSKIPVSPFKDQSEKSEMTCSKRQEEQGQLKFQHSLEWLHVLSAEPGACQSHWSRLNKQVTHVSSTLRLCGKIRAASTHSNNICSTRAGLGISCVSAPRVRSDWLLLCYLHKMDGRCEFAESWGGGGRTQACGVSGELMVPW